VVKLAARVDVPPIRLQPGAQVPLYRQLALELRRLIANGDLEPGERVPASRGFAAVLGVSRNTVLNAYGELFASGMLVGRVGDGSYISAAAARLRRPPEIRYALSDFEGNPIVLMTRNRREGLLWSSFESRCAP
jgi:DNA-binding transcriptional regulator YhcF (GntR family)